MEEKKSKKKKSMSTEEYKKLCVKKHGDTYILDTVEYISMKDYVYPICKKHGQFKICAYDFAHLRGCPHCGRKNKKKAIFKHSRRNMNFDEFKIIAEQLHNNKYKYIRNSFVNLKAKMKIICPIHGEFEQAPHSHLNGHGCEKCGIIKRSLAQTITNEDFISKCVKIHNGYYDYTKTKYTGCYNDVDVVCPKHGLFTVPAYSHLQGHGCKKCAIEKNALKLLKPLGTFIEDAKKKHPNENSDYSQVRYLGAKVPIEIVCPNGHHYWQKPNKHLSGHSCPYCAKIVSSYEIEIQDFLKSIGLSFETSKRSILSNSQEIDILIPYNNVAIEFDGLYWHNEINKESNYHLNKTIECEREGIKLFHIFEDEWVNKRNIIISKLNEIFHKNQENIRNEDCIIRIINNNEAYIFLNNNHIKGGCKCDINYGLIYNNEIVSIMSFDLIGKNKQYELMQYCDKLNTNIVDGNTTLFKFVLSELRPSEIIYHSDRRFPQNDFIQNLGFKIVSKTKPNYFYVIGNKRVDKSLLSKSLLVENYNCPQSMSKESFYKAQKWYKIYDCGNIKYKMVLSLDF